MRKLFDGQVFDVLPLPNGVIFSYCRDTIDENTVIGYIMISFETGKANNVAKNIYLLTKFGSNYKILSSMCDNYITTKTLSLSNGNTFMVETTGEGKLVGNDGNIIWSGEMTYKGVSPHGLVLYKNSIWASYNESNVLLRFNLSNMREELRIGGNKSPFLGPKGIFLKENRLIVCNFDGKSLLSINLDSYIVKEEEIFEEKVSEYLEIHNYKFIVLESGLYLL